MRYFALALLFGLHGVAFGQWSVYDEKVYEEIKKINKIEKIGSDVAKLDQYFKSQESSGGSGQTVTLGNGSAKAVYKGMDTKFETLFPDANDPIVNRYIGSKQDCGSNEGKFIEHYNACVGLRNLRVQTLMQSQDILKVIAKRREQIVDLVNASRNIDEASGKMQRYHFELQALQSLMQTDAMQLQVLMDGYKQREKMYEVQMVEARRALDTGRYDPAAGAPRRVAVPFLGP